MSERTPAEYADAVESFVHAIQNATEVTRQRDEALAALARVRALASALHALSMDTLFSDATLAERYLRIETSIRAAIEEPS